MNLTYIVFHKSASKQDVNITSLKSLIFLFKNSVTTRIDSMSNKNGHKLPNWAQSVSHNKTFASYYEGLMIFHVHKSVCSWLLPKLRLYQKHNFRYKKQVFFQPGAIFKILKGECCCLILYQGKKVSRIWRIYFICEFILYFANGYYCLT